VTSIDFYFNAPDRLQVACRLAGKAFAQKKRLLVFAPDGDLAQRIDRMLWTWQATGFLPHCLAHDPLAPDTPVLIAAEPETAPSCDILLNLGADCPPRFESYERVLEIVAREDAEKLAGRARFKFYRDRGFAISSHDLAAPAPRHE
jgi:DNA polymerase-3 subunit chi